MKMLSDNKIIVGDLFRSFGYQKIQEFEKYFGNDFPIISVERESGRSYYHIETTCQKDKDFYPGINSKTGIWKVEEGVFKGGACVVEECHDRLQKETYVSVITEAGIFKYPKIKGELNLENLEMLLSDDGLCFVLAKEMSVFDISKKYQNYEFMCERLPHRFWQNLDLVAKTLVKFSDIKTVNLIGVEHCELVRIDGVRRKAVDFFNGMEMKNSGRFDVCEKEKSRR